MLQLTILYSVFAGVVLTIDLAEVILSLHNLAFLLAAAGVGILLGAEFWGIGAKDFTP